MTLAVSGGSSQIISAARILALLAGSDGVGSGLDADTLRGEGPQGTPALPGGSGGIPMYGQVFSRRPDAYPASLFRI